MHKDMRTILTAISDFFRVLKCARMERALANAEALERAKEETIRKQQAIGAKLVSAMQEKGFELLTYNTRSTDDSRVTYYFVYNGIITAATFNENGGVVFEKKN
jgi:hypothetical protein